ncbi:MAG: succinate dehydrogenase cytochrome b subunit [Actinomycetota bacterium]
MAQTMPRGTDHSIPPIRRRAPELPWPLNLYQTAIGKKYAMAITGVGLLGFVVVHMIGNLHLYEGPTEVHEYAEALRELGGHLVPREFVLWVLRLGLLTMFAVHIHAAYSLSRMNAKANKAYAGNRDYIAVNFASRTMRWTGPIILLYLLWHIADLTLGYTSDAGVTNGDFVYGDVYNNVYISLSVWWITAIYVVANVALAIHIFHGAWSMFQTLGINNPRYNGLRKNFARGLATVILLGNLSFPLAVNTGLIDLDGHTPGQYSHSEEGAAEEPSEGDALGDEEEGE